MMEEKQDLLSHKVCKTTLSTLHVADKENAGKYFKLGNFMYCLKCHLIVKMVISQEDIQ